MASSCEASCISDPNFAVICAFLERFASSCGIEFPTFVDLQEMLENVDQVPQELIDLHIKLLRKARKTVFIEKWERALIKFCHTYSSQDGWEIERFGYKKSKLEVKIRVLKMLLEGQFDLNQKFKAQINTLESGELRTKPLGKDKLGRLYWLQTDPVSNIRVYREDMDEESWTLVAKDRPSLVELLQELSGEETPVDLNLLNEDSVSLDVDKPVIDTGQNENGSIKGEDEESDEKVCVNGAFTKEMNDDAQEQQINGDAEKDNVCNRLNEDVKVGEAIEEPIMYITGEGAGAECEAANPDKEEEQSEHVEESASNTSEHDLSSEKQKLTPKLWSIDTICGVNSTEVNEVKHKNFSSFSIDSVLEKKDSDATFSKYTVNCPFESNSVGGEQSSDVNLKTDINNDAVPYWEVSVSESSISTPSVDIHSSIKSSSETEGNMHPLMVKPNAEVPFASNESSKEISKKLDDINCETAKSDIKETSCETELLVTEGIKNAGLIQNASNNQKDSIIVADKLENSFVKKQTVEIINSSLEPQAKFTENEKKEFLIAKEIKADIVQGNTKKEIGTVTKPPFEQKNLIYILPENKQEAAVEVPKLVDQKIELKTLNVSEISKEKEKETELLTNTQTEKVLESKLTIEEKTPPTEIIAELAAEPEMSKTDVLKAPKHKNDNEKVITPEIEEEIRGIKAVEENQSLKISKQELVPKKIKSLESKIEKSDITKEEIVENSEEKESEKELQEKMYYFTPVETKLEEKKQPEVKEEVIKPSAPTKLEPKVENEKPKDEHVKVEERNLKIVGEQTISKDEKEDEKDFEKKIEKVEGKGNDVEMQNDGGTVEKNDKELVVEVETRKPEIEEDSVKNQYNLEEEEEKPTEKNLEKPRSEDVLELDSKTLDEMHQAEKTNESDESEKQKDEIYEKPEIKETNSSVKDKEEKKLKRELVIAIEKMETVPDNKKEDQTETVKEKANEEKMAPRKQTRSSTKFKEGEVEKDEDKETKEEESGEVDKSKKGKKELRRLSRSRRSTEESLKVEERPRMTRGMRKSVGLEETPKQTKGRQSKRKAVEDENVLEVEGEVAEPAEDENEKSEEEGEENEKDVEKLRKQKPQARRPGRKPKNRRRRFFNFAKKKVHEENENDDKETKKEQKDKEVTENQEKKEKKRRRKRDEATLLRDRAAQELKLLGVIEDTEMPTIRQSRRIAQIKLKEEAERRRLEALQLESFKKEKDKKGKKKKKSKFESDSGDEEKKEKDEEDSDDEMPKKERRRKKKADKLKFNELNPWLSSSGSSTVDEEEEELEDEPHEDDELVFKSDHEFSPESDVEDPDYKPVKRARTAKVEESEEKGGKYDDTACEKCGNKDHPEWILLCDKCDKGWHASCVRPALMVVPEGDWFCPPCEHISLIEKLKESLVQYDRSQKQRENEELRRKRLAFVGISLDNVLPPAKKIPKEEKDENDDEKSGSESSSESESSETDSDSSNSSEPVYQLRERRTNVTSYRYNEYDELIKSALKDEIEAVKGAGNAGRGKDINNIVNAEKRKENDNPEEEGEDILEEEQVGNEEEKPKEKSKKDEDGDYELETEEEEEDENVVDEIPPVVPKNTGLKKKRSKSVKITSLDFTSEEEDNNSDSDFKGTSEEEESECSLPSESESSEEIGRRRRGYDGPVRRSTRARISRYDRNFINDDSEEDEPKRKRHRSWESSESSDSDRSWGRKKRKKGGSTSRAKKLPNEKKKKKKQKKRALSSDDDNEQKLAKKSRSRKIIYGGLDEEPILTRRTRGKKINYQEMNGSDSEDDQPRKTTRVIESDDDFVAENDKDEEAQNAESEEIESGVDEEEDTDAEKEKEKKPTEKKKKILEKIKKKKWVIPDPDDFSEDDLMEEKQLDELNEELEDLDEEEEEILGNILEKGDVPINELRDAVKRAKDERRKKKESGAEKCEPESLPKTFPPIPAHMEFGGGKFPKIGKVKITPSRAELASMKGLPQKGLPGFNATGFLTPEKQEDKPVLLRTLPSEKGLEGPNIPTSHSKTVEQRLYPYQMEAPPQAGPLTMMAMMNSQQGDDSSIGAKNGPPQYSYQGMTGYPPNIPTTVMGISDIEAQGKKKPGPKPGTKMKKKMDDGDDNAASGDEFKTESGKTVRGRGKKLEGDTVSTVQPPTQFPPVDSGSVITRMLNTPQYESNQFALRNPPFRPIHFTTPPRPPPPIRARVPGPMFHTSHPHDPSPSGGGPINISTKPSPPSPTFNRAPVPIMQRFPDPRFSVQGSPSRPEFSAYGNYYGNYPQPDEAGFHNPPSYPEQFAEGAPPPLKPFEDETGGEFGGLASYFASQREEDLDT